MNQIVAIYARVSSDHQKEQNTIASQLAALREYAQTHQYTIGPQWTFEDDGYSGSTLSRPALERLRDAVSEGLMESILVYSPDRLSRNFAHQLLLAEEFARQGAKIIFLNAPRAETAEEKLMVQLQGMIAEYERAQIVERCRRGKRHRAKSGSLHVLASAPYGYRYIRKTDSSHGYYEIHEPEAEVVRQIFALFTVEGRSIQGIARHLNSQNIPTRSKKSPWGDATIWYMLKNPTYYGRAAYGKSESVPVQRVNRTSRQQGRYLARQLTRLHSNHQGR